MINKRFQRYVIVCIAMICALSVTVARAQEPGKPPFDSLPPHHADALARSLQATQDFVASLTPEQQAAIREIYARYEPELAAIRGDLPPLPLPSELAHPSAMEMNPNTLPDLASGSLPSISSLFDGQTTFQELQQTAQRIAAVQVRIDQEIDAILTPEQRALRDKAMPASFKRALLQSTPIKP